MKSLVLSIVVAGSLLGVATEPAAASVLCKSKKGGLLVRDACKKKEAPVLPGEIADLGLGGGGPGPAGPVGPAGPQGLQGPAGLPGSGGGGLTIVDAGGREVGIVTSIFTSYYGSSGAEVLRSVLAPGASAPEWFIFSVGSSGFKFSDYGSSFTFATSDCSGTRYFSTNCEYGACADIPLALPVYIEPDGHSGTFARAAERQTQQFYRVTTISAPTTSADTLPALCTAPAFGLPGVIVRPAYSCAEGQLDPYSCLDCCVPFGDGSPPTPTASEAAPVRTLDVSTFGLTPPFRFQR